MSQTEIRNTRVNDRFRIQDSIMGLNKEGLLMERNESIKLKKKKKKVINRRVKRIAFIYLLTKDTNQIKQNLEFYWMVS